MSVSISFKCTGMKFVDEDEGREIYNVSFHYWDDFNDVNNGHFDIPMVKRLANKFCVGDFYELTFQRKEEIDK